jgi:hypothetical protein
LQFQFGKSRSPLARGDSNCKLDRVCFQRKTYLLAHSARDSDGTDIISRDSIPFIWFSALQPMSRLSSQSLVCEASGIESQASIKVALQGTWPRLGFVSHLRSSALNLHSSALKAPAA